MKHIFKKALLVLLLMQCALIANDKSTISVLGRFEIPVVPDIISINFSITNKDDKSIEAVNKKDRESVLKLEKIFKDENITSKDITLNFVALNTRTDNYDYGNDNNTVKSYESVRSVTVLLKDITKYPDFIDKISKIGGTSSYVTVQSSQTKDKTKEAFQKAVMNAKEKAQFTADSLGKKLVDIICIDEVKYDLGGDLSLVRPVSLGFAEIGELAVKADVRVTFELK